PMVGRPATAAGVTGASARAASRPPEPRPVHDTGAEARSESAQRALRSLIALERGGIIRGTPPVSFSAAPAGTPAAALRRLVALSRAPRPAEAASEPEAGIGPDAG